MSLLHTFQDCYEEGGKFVSRVKTDNGWVTGYTY